jgi:hypothetical protein
MCEEMSFAWYWGGFSHFFSDESTLYVVMLNHSLSLTTPFARSNVQALFVFFIL